MQDLQHPVTSDHTALRGCSNVTGSCGVSGSGGGGVTPDLHCWEAAASALCCSDLLIEVKSRESLFKDVQHSINTSFALWQSSTAATLINMSPRPTTVNHKSPARATGTWYSLWTPHTHNLPLTLTPISPCPPCSPFHLSALFHLVLLLLQLFFISPSSSSSLTTVSFPSSILPLPAVSFHPPSPKVVGVSGGVLRQEGGVKFKELLTELIHFRGLSRMQNACSTNQSLLLVSFNRRFPGVCRSLQPAYSTKETKPPMSSYWHDDDNKMAKNVARWRHRMLLEEEWKAKWLSSFCVLTYNSKYFTRKLIRH